MTTFLPSDTFVGLLFPDVVSPARCDQLVGELVQRGFDATGEHYPRDYRNNDRLVFDDAALAAELFAQLRDRLPAELDIAGTRWQLCGLNTRFRACRYHDGQSFCIHRDGPHVPSDELRSHLTVQLYLDDVAECNGGRTRFYADPRGERLWASITAQRGTAIVFDHRAWHDGEAVTGSVKHVLRTDAMYRAVGPALAAPRDVIGRHRGYAWRVIACRDGSLASSGRDGTVRRWGRTSTAPRAPSALAPNALAPNPSPMLDLAAGSVTTLVEDADGKLWCGTRAGALFAIDGDTPTRIADNVGATLGATATTTGVVFATSRGTLVAHGSRTWTADVHRGWAWSVEILADGRIASCGDDGHVVITDDSVGANRPVAGAAVRSRPFAELGVPLRAIAPLASGELVVGDTRGWLYLLARDSSIRATWRAHTAAVTALAVAPDGRWFASASEDGRVRAWREATLLGDDDSSHDFVTSVAIDAHGRVFAAGYDGSVWTAALTPCQARPSGP